jgi:hypothetical protein
VDGSGVMRNTERGESADRSSDFRHRGRVWRKRFPGKVIYIAIRGPILRPPEKSPGLADCFGLAVHRQALSFSHHTIYKEM